MATQIRDQTIAVGLYRDSDKSLTRPGRKQATATQL